MKSLINLSMKQCIWSFLLLLSFFACPAGAADGQATVAGIPAKEALRLGEAMYQKGMLPSGQPLEAIFQGDLEVSGIMTACSNCHRHSGLGGLEGGVLTPPTNGAKIYAPLLGPEDIPGSDMKRYMFEEPPRPAYTDETLAASLISGIDPTGRLMSETMPRYFLDEKDAKIMVFYLKNLSSQLSPGVTEDEIRFATILTEGVPPAEKDAMLLPLQAYIKEEWNVVNARLSQLSAFTRQTGPKKSFRKAALDVWELKGPPATWGNQLEEFYRKQPVFAILGGIVPGKWAPIHEFCEKNQIPCIFPFTDLPVISGTDWYTLYFSEGFYQEGEAAAKYLSRVIDLPPDKQIVQVFRDNDEGNALVRGFADTWKKHGKASLVNRTISAKEKTGVNFWKGLAATYPDAVMLIWLGPTDLAGIESLAEPGKQSTLFVSASMLGGALTALPDKVRDFTFIAYPTRLPDDGEYTRSIVTSWMQVKKIPLTNMAISSKTFFLTRLLTIALLEVRENLYRDYFLDVLDDGKDEIYSSVAYPRLSFGPGQRYASKGCFIVTLTKGENPKVVRQSEWVIY
jgi:ABC-type branched-subunit amino acid transport system substrate-binding protein